MDIFSSASRTARLIADRQVSPVEVMEATLEAVDAKNEALNAVIWRNDEQALADAKSLEDRIASGEPVGPFAGVPIPIKDLTAVGGWPITYGSSAVSGAPSEHDEMVVAAFRRAGFILTGRTNTPEFGPITVTENSRYGITRNPWDLNHTPGGSSGGAAASVAGGMFSVAHANDGGGSIRIPASCTGLVGLKPSRDRVPADVPGWFGMAVEGVVTHTVEDTARILDLISGPDRLAWANAPVPARPFADEVGAPVRPLRIALVEHAPMSLPIAPEPARAVQVAAGLLEQLGHHVEPLAIDLFPDEGLIHFLNVIDAGFGDYDGIDPTALEPHNEAAYQAAQAVNALDLVGSLGALQQISRQVVSAFGRDFDLLLTPTMTIEPPVAGSVLAEAHASASTPLDVVAMAALTGPFNVSGQPAISLPLHWSESGLPIGVQLVGGPWEESLLIAVAAQLEAAAPWSDRVPGL